MEILQQSFDRTNKLLTQDYCPNPAMVNEFQTLFFTCKLLDIELPGKELGAFIVEENEIGRAHV